MAITPGTKLGSFEITGALGKGGMGEVYLATDTKLGRDVAIKVLPESLAADPERLARFEREAQTLAALNHPNVATVYGFEHDSQQNIHYLIMEHIDGETLGERIDRGALPLKDALPIFIEIGRGLDAAHEAGIVHRDLKPDNLKINSDEIVKVLDFGLAKNTTGEQRIDPDAPTTPMSPVAVTEEGTFMGTPMYMSPEQARGAEVDKRTDIWAFGCCLYETLTGEIPFKGDTVADTVGAILEREPDWSKLPENTPREIRSLLRRCLEKEARRRFSSLGDMAYTLDDFLENQRNPDHKIISEAPGEPPRSILKSLSFMVVIALASAGITWSVMKSDDVNSPRNAASEKDSSGPFASPLLEHPKMVRRSVIPLAPGDTLKESLIRQYAVAVSPDGSHAAYTVERGGVTQLLLHPLAQLTAIEIPETDGAMQPAFSPDGQSLSFYADGFLKRVSIHGGIPEKISDGIARPMGSCWEDSNTVIMTSNVRAPMQRLHIESGVTESLMKLGQSEGVHAMPHVLPGGKGLLFVAGKAPTMATSTVELYVFETKERHVLMAEATRPHYLFTGHIVVAQEGRFTAIPFDLESLEVTGPPFQIAGEFGNETPRDFGISRDGMLVHARDTNAQGKNRILVWVDDTGKREAVAAPPRPYYRVRISPSGTQAAIIMDDFKDIFMLDLTRGGTPRSLTFGDESGIFPIWTPDNRELVFLDRLHPEFRLGRKSVDGTGEAVRFMRDANFVTPAAITSDGNTLLASTYVGPNGPDIVEVSLASPYEITPLVNDPGRQGDATLSPDEQWLAYVSDESGKSEIFIRPYPSLDGKWRVSTGVAYGPQWDRDSQSLFYRSENRVMAVTIQTEPTFFAGEPALLFEEPYHFDVNNSTYDRSPIDDRFLMISPGAEGSKSTELIVVENWFEEIKQADPANAN
jgi:serine/threonine-protein kinase